MYEQRPDLVYTGRTLFGAARPRVRSWTTTTSAAVKPRVAAFMRELDEELWELGVSAKTEHNEVAPAQHELARVYDTANIATDHNQLRHGRHAKSGQDARSGLPPARKAL